jgi:uracil-DNA glycosylase
MADPAFRRDQWDRRFQPHVARINELVDDLRRQREGRVPYVAPLYGGANAQILFIFQDPGPGTDASAAGSGFLCSENDDPSAEVFSECLEASGLVVSRVITWNAYPWALALGESKPSADQLQAGVEPLGRLLTLLPKLKVVALMGQVAQKGWAFFARSHPAVAHTYHVLPGLHTSGRGITRGGQHTKPEGVAKVQALMRTALEAIDMPIVGTSQPSEKMSEAEVSLRVAFYLLERDLVQSDVEIAIDGAQIKTGGTIHFAIGEFLAQHGCLSVSPNTMWQGSYSWKDYPFSIKIHSNPGKGDVVARLRSGHTLHVESKKGPLMRSISSQEYLLLREAIGQLMTTGECSPDDLLAVAVPASPKFAELTERWRKAPLISRLGIRLLTVDRNNQVEGLDLPAV